MTTRFAFKKKIILSSSFLVFFLAAGCKNSSEQSQPVAPKSIKPEKAQASQVQATVITDTPKYEYLTEGRRDPFQPFVLIKRPIIDAVTGEALAESPLQQYETLQYKISGVIVGYGEPMAMILDPAGRPHVVRIGSKVGKSGGTVTKISRDAILVEEKYRDLSDAVKINLVEIKLPKREGV